MNNHISILVILIVDVSVVLLLNCHVGLCSCYNRIFSFGDDTMDTGNFIHLIGKTPSKYKEAPYGKTFFRHATGRISDGRVLIDFYAAKKQFLSDSLVIMGGIGENDYYSYFIKGKPPKDGNIISDVIADISHFIEELIVVNGAKAFVVANNFPVGCLASYLSRFHSDDHEDYDEHGCLKSFNEFSQKHNEQLYSAIGQIRYSYPNVKVIYADYYNATMEFIKKPSRFGIGDPLVACCGGNGPYHTSMECNGTAKLWGDPHHFANWDGMHMTEKAYNIIMEGVLNGPFADPPFPLSC
ncbi:GDSL esterase/lipase [Zea mays]|uniref:GDSL esterase/lipase n=1 Tax=Zea mays TaxID=4577 RepID=A0A317YIK6_MAIZE|nr:GDSL esterase/lipase [Zea mays]